MTCVRIAHLSDPHFGTVAPEVQAALLARLAELRLDLVLISGDITQRARRAQFRAARAFKEALQPVPAFAVPGNHDIPLINLPARLLRPYGGFHRYLQSTREAVIQVGGVRVFGLNSTSRWRHIQGRLDVERVRPALMRPDRSTVRIACVHHPLDCAKRVDDKNLLVDREPVFALFEAAAIDLVLSGHVHDPFVTLSDARYPASRRAMILSVAGTCLSHRTRKGAPNSFNYIEVAAAERPRITLARNDIAPDGRFRTRDDCVDVFERDEAGWRRAGLA
jgi:3',5'-cyclic AMP phosphodiesterase CpdA